MWFGEVKDGMWLDVRTAAKPAGWREVNPSGCEHRFQRHGLLGGSHLESVKCFPVGCSVGLCHLPFFQVPWSPWCWAPPWVFDLGESILDVSVSSTGV